MTSINTKKLNNKSILREKTFMKVLRRENIYVRIVTSISRKEGNITSYLRGKELMKNLGRILSKRNVILLRQNYVKKHRKICHFCKINDTLMTSSKSK